jgi:hypothetical protein
MIRSRISLLIYNYPNIYFRRVIYRNIRPMHIIYSDRGLQLLILVHRNTCSYFAFDTQCAGRLVKCYDLPGHKIVHLLPFTDFMLPLGMNEYFLSRMLHTCSLSIPSPISLDTFPSYFNFMVGEKKLAGGEREIRG